MSWSDAVRPSYLVPVTLPRELRALAFHHQALVYGALMQSAAGARQALAADPRYVGAHVGCLAVLHTWTRALLYHPHVHVVVTAGDGARVLAYLARYLFRVAISNSRLEQIDHGHVTFRYRDNRTQQIRRATLSGVEFLRRFLRHVLPRGYTKVPAPNPIPVAPSCPLCHSGTLTLIAVLRRQCTRPP